MDGNETNLENREKIACGENGQSTAKTRNRTRIIFEAIIIIVLIPLTLLISWRVSDRQYYLFSVVVMILMMLPLLIRFERRRPSARELVTLAVMTALAAASRAAFVMIPHFTPMTGIIMITGIALGAEAGFITGCMGAFVSNFVFGQGPWTPWQMFAYGLAGLLAGWLGRKGIMTPDKRLRTAIIGGLSVLCFIGPLLDTATLFLISMQVNTSSIGAVYLAGIPVNAIHGLATFLTLLLLCRPITEKLDRIRVKYGMMAFDETEVSRDAAAFSESVGTGEIKISEDDSAQ